MAQVPIEVAEIGNLPTSRIDTVLAVANEIQSEFLFERVPERLAAELRPLAADEIHAPELFESIDRARRRVRGFHPYVVAIVDSYLKNDDWGYLFGDRRADGLGVFTTFDVPEIILPRERLEAYFLYYLGRYALSFIVPDHQNHDDRPECVFHSKVEKHLLLESMRARALCSECRRELTDGDHCLSPDQLSALLGIIGASGAMLDGLPPDEGRMLQTQDSLPSSEMRILFLASNPATTSRLDLAEEVRGVKEELRAVTHRDSISFSDEHAVRVRDLVRLVRDVSPTVLHFSGHGSEAGIHLCDEAGAPVVVAPDRLRQFLTGRGIELVVLNACFTQPHAAALAEVVPCVIGTTYAVGDVAARTYSRTFYRVIGNGLPVAEAHRDGRDSVHLPGLADVFCHAGDLTAPLTLSA